jgi:hypothetical protein
MERRNRKLKSAPEAVSSASLYGLVPCTARAKLGTALLG